MPDRPDRRLDGPDRLIVAFDRVLRGMARVDCGSGSRRPAGSGEEGGDGVDDGRERPHPAGGGMEEALDDRERRHSAGLIRVNHAGEGGNVTPFPIPMYPTSGDRP